MKKILIAHMRIHAEYYIRQILHEDPSTFSIITDGKEYKLNSYDRGSEITIVRDKSFVASIIDRENFSYLISVCRDREFQMRRVWI